MMQSHFTKDVHGQFGDSRITSAPSLPLVELVNYAINAYGFLIDRHETVTPVEFADRIRKAYDCVHCPQNRAVVEALGYLL